MKKALAVFTMLAFATVANAQFDMTDTIAGSFTDISATGTALFMSDDACVHIPSTVSNDFCPAGGLDVNSNGTAGVGYFDYYYDTGLPDSGFHGGGFGMAPFWDDLNPSAGGQVYWQEIDDVLIVQWDGVPHYFMTGATTFQIKVFGSGSVRAQYIYEDMSFEDPMYDYGADATVGYQISYPDDYLQWSYHEAVIQDGLVLSVIPEPASLSLLMLGGLALLRRR